MYQVLYRKWRPQRFGDVYGQKYIAEALKNEVHTGRLSHAYLFSGSRGTGKTSCAKILAKAVNCLNPQEGEPCNQCDNCRGIDDGAITDVMEIDAASNNGVDNIRELREEVNFAPSVVRYRFYIIDEVHMLSTGAFNALLKTIEEPPAHVIFVLATTEVHKLPATILSRCQRFDFNRVLPEDIVARIRFIEQHEDFSVTDDAAFMIAGLADGGLRDALSLLEQCVTHSKEVTADVVADVAGLIGKDHLFELFEAVRTGDCGRAITLVNKLHNASLDMERLCFEIIEFYRNLMIVKSVSKPDRLMVASPTELENLKKEAQAYEFAKILHCMDVLQATLGNLKAGASRRAAMEMAVLRLCSPELDSDISALLRRVDELEKAIKISGKAPAPQVRDADFSDNAEIRYSLKEQKAKPARERRETADLEKRQDPESGVHKSGGEDIIQEVEFSDWGRVVDILSSTCPPLYGVLQGSAAAIRGDIVLIETDNGLFKSLVTRDGNKTVLANAIKSVTGQAYRIGVKKKPSAEQPKDDDTLSKFINDSRDLGVSLEVK